MKILITRPIDEAICLSQKLGTLGYDSVICPLLEVKIFNDINFAILDKYDAIIVSSSNAIKAIAKANKKLKLFIVGKKTTEFAKTMGFKNSIYSGANINELKDTIQDYSNLLYLSGVDISDDLSSLEKNIDRLNVYEAKMVESVPDNFLAFIKRDHLKLSLFFSKRTALAFLNLIHENKLEPYCGNIISLSLSKKISDTLKDLKLRSYYTAKEPTLQSLISSIKKIHND